VADFLGQTNLIRGVVSAKENGTVRVRTPLGELIASVSDLATIPPEVLLSIRPHLIHIAKDSPGIPQTMNRLKGKLVESTFQGESSEHVIAIGVQRLKLICSPPMVNSSNSADELTVEFAAEDVAVLAE